MRSFFKRTRQVLIVLLVFLTGFGLEAATVRRDSVSVSKDILPGRWLLVSLGYRYPVINRQVINSGHGFGVEIGLNLGKIVSKKLLAGIYAGWSFMDRSWSTSFSGDFTASYAASLNAETGFSADEQKLIRTSAETFAAKHGSSVTMPGCEMNSFHNYSLYYGIFFRPAFNHAPVVKLYTGSTRSHYQGGGGLVTARDYNIIQLRRPMVGMELMAVNLLNKIRILNRLSIGLYAEHTFLDRSTLYFDDGHFRENIPLARFTGKGLLKKYNSEQICGLRLSFFI